MSKKNRGRRRLTAGTHATRLAGMLERMRAFHVRNMLQPRRRKQK